MDENNRDRASTAAGDAQAPPIPAAQAAEGATPVAVQGPAVSQPAPVAPVTPALPNLKALPYEDAQAVMHRLLAYQKVLEREVATKEHELISWHEKLAYARSKSDERLVNECGQRLQEVQAEYEGFVGKLETERVHNAILRDQLADMAPGTVQQAPAASPTAAAPAEAPTRRSDAEIERDILRHRVDDELAAIKEKLGGQPPGP